MLIGIFGAEGFVGSSLIKHFDTSHKLVKITKKNYTKMAKMNLEFDLIINCCGNSSKRLAEQDPIFSLEATVKTIYEIARDFKCKQYIYISSIDVLFPGVYGTHKHFAEKIVRQLHKKSTCLRCGAIVGKNAKKGLTYDIDNGSEVYLSKDSKQQLVYVEDLVEFIKYLLTLGSWDRNYQCWSPDNISPDEIGEILDKPVIYGEKLNYQNYNCDLETNIYHFKTCEEVIKAYKEEI